MFAVDLQDMKRSQKIAAAVALEQAGIKGVKIIPRGVLISAIYLGTPAAKALRPGDTVVEVDGKPVRTPLQLATAIRSHKPGTVVHMKVRRSGHIVPVAVKTVHDPQDLAMRGRAVVTSEEAVGNRGLARGSVHRRPKYERVVEVDPLVLPVSGCGRDDRAANYRNQVSQ